MARRTEASRAVRPAPLVHDGVALPVCSGSTASRLRRTGRGLGRGLRRGLGRWLRGGLGWRLWRARRGGLGRGQNSAGQDFHVGAVDERLLLLSVAEATAVVVAAPAVSRFPPPLHYAVLTRQVAWQNQIDREHSVAVVRKLPGS